MLKDHFIEGIEWQPAGGIGVLQCGHGHVQLVSLVAQRRLLGCDHFMCLLTSEQKSIHQQEIIAILCIH